VAHHAAAVTMTLSHFHLGGDGSVTA